MFLPDLAAALNGMRRLLVPGGRVATVVWGAPAKTPILGVAMGVMREMFQLPPPPEMPGLNSLVDTKALEQAFTRAGFADVRSESLVGMIDFSSTEEYIDFLRDIASPIRALLANQPTERRKRCGRLSARLSRDSLRLTARYNAQ